MVVHDAIQRIGVRVIDFWGPVLWKNDQADEVNDLFN